MDETIIRNIKLLANEARKFFDFEKVYVFGSYSKGNFREESDIDIAFIVNKISDNHFQLSAKLYELVNKIDCRMEPVILNKNNDKSGFVKNIIENGIGISF